MRLVVLCAVLLGGLVLAGGVLAAEPIRLGAIVSATGPASFLGEPEKNTLLEREKAINEAGGVLGRPVEIVVLDDETDVNKAVLAADRLLKKENVVAVIGPTVSGNTLAVVPKFQAAKVPLVSCAAAEKIVRPVNPYVFKTAQSDRLAVARILAHAKARGYKTLAILTVSDGYGQAGREVLKELIPAGGFSLAADEVYGPKDTDMTPQLTRIKGLAPDAVICWGTNPGPAVVAKNRVQLGLATPLYMSHGVASKKFVELAGQAAEGLLLPAGKLTVADQLAQDDPQKKVLQEYVAAYAARYNVPPSAFGGYAHDALSLILAAVRAGNDASPAAIRDNLERVKGFAGITGVFNLGPEEHNGLDETAFVMVTISGGEFRLLADDSARP